LSLVLVPALEISRNPMVSLGLRDYHPASLCGDAPPLIGREYVDTPWSSALAPKYMEPLAGHARKACELLHTIAMTVFIQAFPSFPFAPNDHYTANNLSCQ